MNRRPRQAGRDKVRAVFSGAAAAFVATKTVDFSLLDREQLVYSELVGRCSSGLPEGIADHAAITRMHR